MELIPLTEVQIKPLLFKAAVVKKYDLTILPLTYDYEGPNVSNLAKNIKKIISSALEVLEDDIKESNFSLSRKEKETLKASYAINKVIDSNCYYRFEIDVSYEVDANDYGKFSSKIKGSLYFELPQETSFQKSILFHFFFSLYWNFYYSKIVDKYIEQGKQYLNRYIDLLKSKARI